MQEKELLELIASRSKALTKDCKRMKATLYPKKQRPPKKRKIKRIKQ